MRVLAIIAALTFITAPVLVVPTAPAPPPPAPAPVVIEEAPETVTLSDSFFAGGGGVGADVGLETFYSSGSTVIIRGGSAHASAFAFVSARASAGVGGHFGGGRGGHGRGHGCGCR